MLIHSGRVDSEWPFGDATEDEIHYIESAIRTLKNILNQQGKVIEKQNVAINQLIEHHQTLLDARNKFKTNVNMLQVFSLRKNLQPSIFH